MTRADRGLYGSPDESTLAIALAAGSMRKYSCDRCLGVVSDFPSQVLKRME